MYTYLIVFISESKSIAYETSLKDITKYSILFVGRTNTFSPQISELHRIPRINKYVECSQCKKKKPHSLILGSYGSSAYFVNTCNQTVATLKNRIHEKRAKRATEKYSEESPNKFTLR